jgi:hypothetical protein
LGWSSSDGWRDITFSATRLPHRIVALARWLGFNVIVVYLTRPLKPVGSTTGFDIYTADCLLESACFNGLF